MSTTTISNIHSNKNTDVIDTEKGLRVKTMTKYLKRRIWKITTPKDDFWWILTYKQAMENTEIENHTVIYFSLFNTTSMSGKT